MCEPTSIMLGISAVVGAYGAYTTYQAGQSQKDIANYQADQAEADARTEVGYAKVEADKIRKAGQRAAEEANAAIAGSGQDLSSAGSLAINREVYRGAESDAYLALVGGTDRGTRMQTQASLTRTTGRMQAKAATASAFSQAANATNTGYKTYKTAKAGGG